jgi:antitoxin component of MazEF toxin-antitoxin module
MTVIVKKLGGSVAVVIPKTIARDMDLTEGTPLELLSSPSGITLRKGRSRQRRSMKEIVAEIKANRCWEHNRDLVDDGGPVGREYW